MNTPDPAFVRRNVRTLSVVGGVYDLVALAVYEDHRELLAEAGFPTYESIIQDLRSFHSGIPHEGAVAVGSGAGADTRPL